MPTRIGRYEISGPWPDAWLTPARWLVVQENGATAALTTSRAMAERIARLLEREEE